MQFVGIVGPAQRVTSRVRESPCAIPACRKRLGAVTGNGLLCAAALMQVFDSLNGASLAANNTGREVWDKCSFINETAGSGEKIQLLEVSGAAGGC